MTEHPMTDAPPLASEQIMQEDREAAADAVLAIRGNKNGDWQGRIRKGECDDGVMVQAFARHRIAALSASPAPVGWKLVPIEPTSEMTEAGEDANYYSGDDIIRNRADPVYRAMLAASPAPSGQGVSGEPVAWAYDLATSIGGDGTYSRFDRRISFQEPSVPEGAIRNLTPLYAAPVPSCAPGEVERIMRAAVQDIADAEPIPTPADAFEWCKMVCSDALARAAALSPQGLDAKEGETQADRDRRMYEQGRRDERAGEPEAFQ